MSKFYKKLCIGILGLVILLNIFVYKNNIVEGVEDRQQGTDTDTNADTNVDSDNKEAMLLAQKNENSLKILTEKITELFNKKMEDLKTTCKKCAKASENVPTH